jgi:hypothetical protein
VRSATAAFAAAWLLCAADAAAWGCEGHRAVVHIAERLLPPSARAAAAALLKSSPADPALKRFCEPFPQDPLVDDAAWADDYRAADPSTFGWHFINIPRTARLTAGNEHIFCAVGGCVVDAIARQYRVLKGSTDRTARANALRYLIHFIGDLHQPLHATTNGDRGGNCVPITYYDRAPQESETTPGDYSPNLHSAWDSSIIRTAMSARGLGNARALADAIATEQPLPARVAAEAPAKSVVIGWAQGSHEVGRTVVYPRLPVAVGVEPAWPIALSSCADNDDVVHRMLAKHIVIGDAYVEAALPSVFGQLRLAGIRLAAALEAAFH